MFLCFVTLSQNLMDEYSIKSEYCVMLLSLYSGHWVDNAGQYKEKPHLAVWGWSHCCISAHCVCSLSSTLLIVAKLFNWMSWLLSPSSFMFYDFMIMVHGPCLMFIWLGCIAFDIKMEWVWDSVAVWDGTSIDQMTYSVISFQIHKNHFRGHGCSVAVMAGL